ncbi:potassium channel family protein [Roseobacter sinensis]|uniref:Potassium channel family protein n=1 Tax=Roseobacter sinensis TaxID=2931391 RepID=A0ABT3B9M7_9RHOB|nr:potassium channel family protein [Roseobacter sp. WL0113]MCV3270243.1 potassium channel family protein [Roseobacter sp. WL0113]
MPVLLQIVFGSALLLVCAMLHILVIGRMVRHLRHHDHFDASRSTRHQMIVTGALFLVLLGSHTVQIYISAFTLWISGALPGYEAPIYYSLVTYTTVGYGDVVLDPEHRIMGAMISVTGILMFGMTTAVVVGLFTRILGEKDL